MASSSQSVEVGADSMPWADASSPAQSPEMHRLAVPPRFSRKNSVSLPADLNAAMESPDLQLTPDSSHDDDDLSDASSFGDLAGLSTEDSEDSDLELGGRAASPLRRVRRKSVMRPPPSLKVNDIDYLDVPDASPGNSITSINSIASLLKEKLALSFPAYLKKKKPPPQYKLKAFVGFLFLVIVFLVGFSYVFYHQHVLQRAFFERMRVNAEERVVRIFDGRGRRVLTGHLGQHLGDSRAFPCLAEHRPSDPDALCLEWTRRGRLYMSHHGPVHCYRLLWLGLDPATPPRDCYDMGRATWYGGGQPDLRGAGEEGKGAAPFVTGPRWGTTLGRHFISSDGVAIAVDARTPLHVSLDGAAVCLEARLDDFAYYSPRGDATPVLNYSVCLGTDVRHVMSALVEPPERPKADAGGGAELLQTLLSEPVWHLAPRRPEALTQAAVERFAEDVIFLNFRQGHVLLGAAWQMHAGDLDVDAERFPAFNDTLSVIKRRGFRLALSLQPFVSTESPSFRDAVRRRLLVRQRGADDYVPALLRHGDALPSAGLLDVTNDEAVAWLRRRLRDVAARYQVNAFFLELGSSRDVPHFYRFHHNLSSPDAYWALFTDAVLGAGVPVLGVSGAVRRPPVPIFVSTAPAVATWDALRGVVPSVLAAGIAGFPLVMPGAVGGDYDVDDDAAPDAELYVRWLQLASFLPVLRYRRLPGVFNVTAELSVKGVAEQLTALRTKTVTPLLKKLTDEALQSGLPLVRPLWMLDPHDPTCHRVSDEFSLGDELIVAPVVSPGATEREVYLPAGVWKDGVDGRLHKGSRWLHRYRVQLHQVAYFEKMPNNTRF